MHDIRFVEDNWESPTLGAWGLGWEVWLNGMEISQFTYFQQVGGLDCRPVSGEITYGLERLAMYLQDVESLFDIVWTEGPQGRVTYRDVFHQNEAEQSTYNFEQADTAVLFRHFDDHERCCNALLEARLALPAYEQVLKASHVFNLLDARHAISVTERQRYILRVRTLARGVAQAYFASREALGFPLLGAAGGGHGRGGRMSDTARSERRDFLFEIGTEELPPKALPELERALRTGWPRSSPRPICATARSTPSRRRAGWPCASGAWRRSSPRRTCGGAGRRCARPLMPTGQPTRAAQAFAASCGVELSQLGRERDEQNNEYLWYRGRAPGRERREPAAGNHHRGARCAADSAAHALGIRRGAVRAPGALAGDALRRARSCRRRSSTRPRAAATRGHRFHAPRELPLRAPASYEKTLLTRGWVIADFAVRRERVREQVMAAAGQAGGRAIIEAALLEEVTALVEWPVAIAGQFEARFLALPREVLLAALQDHQRYFPVQSAAGELLPRFVAVSNIESRDPGVVRAGNERVVRPRLADAAFFWEQDRRAPLAASIEALAQRHLSGETRQRGRQGAARRRAGRQPRSRLRGRTRARGAGGAAVQVRSAERHGRGIPRTAGRHGQPTTRRPTARTPRLRAAIREHYLPRSAGDAACRRPPTGMALALADRLDTLAGIFAIGQKPSGTRDPFGLRRAAIGVLRIVRERALQVDLRALIEQAVAAQPLAELERAPRRGGDEVYEFIMERCARSIWRIPPAGSRREIFDAVLATRSALAAGCRRPRAGAGGVPRSGPRPLSLAAANRRIANILKKSAAATPGAIDPQLLRAPAEQALHAALDRRRAAVERSQREGNYGAAFAELALLRPEVDAFFEHVLVNDPDAQLRSNRLALLGELRALFSGIADLSRLPG